MNKRILIVDDDVSIVRLLSLRLQARNYNVLKAYDGSECIKIAIKEAPDLILMDIKMPNGDGIWAFEKLLQLDTTRNIPVIFMTAYPTTEIKAQLLKFGAKDCISKPFISVDFERTIAMTLESLMSRRQNEEKNIIS
ncbi:response regulator [bacterium]|nr:response regulator [bacterium]